MKYLYSVIICIILSVSFSDAFAQNRRQLIEAYTILGDSSFAKHNYYGAHQAFEKALFYKEKEDANLFFKIAEACRLYQNYADAEKYYRLTLRTDSVTYPLAKFYYAEMLKHQGKYAEAAKQFAEYHRLNRRVSDYFTRRAQHEGRLKDVIELIPTYENINVYRVDNHLINSMYAEYNPIRYNDTLFFFAGIRPADTVMADTTFVFENYWNQILVANMKDSIYYNIREVKGLNKVGLHVGNLSFNKTGDVAYFTRCQDYTCKIYRAKFDVATVTFSNIEELPATINAPGSNNTTPHYAVTPTGDYLFFSSNRRRSTGIMDLWYAGVNANGTFQNPQNLGRTINTRGREITPFYDARDSTLYFSSDWLPGLGGFDIFRVKGNITNNTWREPENLGRPINSSHNDLYYTYSRDSLRAYWVSNRPESERLIGKAYSNDIYYHPLIRRVITRITDLVPIYLYFDNDYPDPRSRDSITDIEYMTLFNNYMDRKEEYAIEFTRYSPPERYEYDLRNIETFFADMENEFMRLFLFAELLEMLLEEGQDIVVAFKGYASPLGNIRYNETLAKRRISCIQNFFNEFNGGSLNRFINNPPNSGLGSLTYVHEPIGQTIMDDTFITGDGHAFSAISDREQQWMSVYSPAAAYQRKIEIIAVNIEYAEELFEQIQREIQTRKLQIDEEIDNETDSYDYYDDNQTQEQYNQQERRSAEEVIIGK